MFNTAKHFTVIMVSAMILGGCMYIENTEKDVLAVSGNSDVSLDSKLCRTFGFRNWSLQRGEGMATISAEASMPTPAWSVMLHQVLNADNGGIELVMETIEPSGPSFTVISWIYFETNVNTDVASQITVKCANEVIWSS